MKKEKLISYNEVPLCKDGPVKLPLHLNTDFKNYDDSFKDVPFPSQNNLLYLLDLDLVNLTYKLLTEEYKQMSSEENLPFLRKSEYITSDYYDKQARRSEALKNLKLKLAKKEEDYSLYHHQSFTDINDEVDCISKYDLHPSDNKINLFFFESEDLTGDITIRNGKIFINDKLHSSNEVDMDDYMIISIEDDKAYYYDIERCLKIKK
ncbi:hypothetical protein H312_02470 [Anncaliia algerae PRA339]|uniref:Uncharacterized protein n=1 Tax=Anncaliia algerae PRA339 TaxID=1288291 RepID=A0A059EYN5_9MICR|nr:hypothetical protein H312_02470 [Anncaliia algerae PRA339]